MNALNAFRAEAWPISNAGQDGRHLLEQVVVASEHADGRGAVHLSPDQALYVQSRLSQIAVAYFPHHRSNGRHPHDQQTTHAGCLDSHTVAPCGAEAWPVIGDGAAVPADVEKVLVVSDHRDGRGAVHLSPDQALYIEERLSRIALEFLHDKGWGGEDARNQ
jgi:hypothetical protein